MNLMKIITNKLDFLLALLAGILLVFAFAPAHFVWLAVLCPAVLYALITKQTAKRATALSFVFGLGFFGTGISWVFVSIYFFGGTSFLIAFLLTSLLVLALSCFFGILGFTLQRYFAKNNMAKILLVYPALWALLEALRSWIFTGFPWLILGHTTANSLFSGLAPIFGAYGSSYFLVLIGSLFYVACVPHYGESKFYGWKFSNLSLTALIVLTIGVSSLSTINWTKSNSPALSVSLVQGNIPQNLRWDAKQVNNILNTYQALTPRYYQNNLIVWPEAAIPLSTEQAINFTDKIEKELETTHSALITGVPYVNKQNYYNAVIGLGDAQGIYLKRHLVPFGEYMPYEKWLRGLIQFFNLPMSNFLPGPPHQSLISVHGIPIGVFICYEVTYSSIVRENLPAAGLLITVSDDAWFGRSFAPWQHLQIGQFTALETGRQMLFVGNDGVTAIINSKGQLQSILPQFTTNVLNGHVAAYTGTTPWVMFGDLPYLIIMLIFLAICYSKPKN
jgi:apolipoprotein N-acyltransferase